MKQSVKTLFRIAQQSHQAVYTQLSEVKKEIQRCKNMVELCDYAFAISEAHKHIDDLKKELFNLRELTENIACQLYVVSNSPEPNIKTDYVTATPDVKMSPNIPSQKADPAAFANLMKWLGIPEEAFSGESSAVKPHWPGLVELISSKIAAGEPCPPGIDPKKMKPLFKLILRKKKGVLED